MKKLIFVVLILSINYAFSQGVTKDVHADENEVINQTYKIESEILVDATSDDTLRLYLGVDHNEQSVAVNLAIDSVVWEDSVATYWLWNNDYPVSQRDTLVLPLHFNRLSDNIFQVFSPMYLSFLQLQRLKLEINIVFGFDLPVYEFVSISNTLRSNFMLKTFSKYGSGMATSSWMYQGVPTDSVCWALAHHSNGKEDQDYIVRVEVLLDGKARVVIQNKKNQKTLQIPAVPVFVFDDPAGQGPCHSAKVILMVDSRKDFTGLFRKL